MAAPVPQRLRLPRTARLQRPGDFARVRRLGQRAVRNGLVINWLVRPEASRSRVGVVTPRAAGSAVQRSRLRRRLRELFRRYQHELAGPVDVVLVARAALAQRSWAEMEHDFLEAARQGSLLAPKS